MNLLLPKDGSIVIIDDQYTEAKPLIDMLSSNGYPSIYFNGAMDSLPPEGVSLERVRVVFADIQLLPALSADDYAQMIIQHLNRLIDDSNGPYILIVWSQMGSVYEDRLKEMIYAQAFTKKPIAFIRLNKADYFRTTSVSSIDTEAFAEIFQTRFDQGDIDFIIETIQEQVPTEDQKQLMPNALIRISNKIRNSLRDYRAFELLISWEKTVQKSATEFVSDISSVHEINEYWDYNFRNIISRLAASQVGQNIEALSRTDFVKASFKTLNSAFADSIDKMVSKNLGIASTDFNSYKNSGYARKDNGQVYKIVWKDFDHYEVYIDDVRKGDDKKTIDKVQSLGNDAQKQVLKEMYNSYTQMSPELNTKLLLDVVTKNPIQPGIVYEVRVPPIRKRKFLTDTYFKKPFSSKDADGNYEIADADLNRIKFIELEVSPNCDFAQRKWLKNRVVSGILFPVSFITTELKNDDSFYFSFPSIKIDDEVYRMVLSFRLLKAVDKNDITSRASKVLFRIKNEPMADIITRLVSHASRIGLLEFK